MTARADAQTLDCMLASRSAFAWGIVILSLSSCNPADPCASAANRGRVSGYVTQLRPLEAHVVDGRFSGAEWGRAHRLEGVLTDVYLDYADGYLYVLNDWRANVEPITPDCFNRFNLNAAGNNVEIRVYGDGHLEVDGLPVDGEGAYGFTASEGWSEPHTVYEFRLRVPEGPIALCCLDPTSGSTCEVLTREPIEFLINASSAGVEVARDRTGEVPALLLGQGCGEVGVCAAGLACLPLGSGHACARVGPEPVPDAALTPRDAAPAPVDAAPEPTDAAEPLDTSEEVGPPF